MTSRALVVAWILSFATSFASGACSSNPPPAAAEPEPASPAEPSAAASSDESQEKPGEMATADPGAAEPAADEMPKNCNFRAKGYCFATSEDACAAAGCAEGKCIVLESQPAKVKCAD